MFCQYLYVFVFSFSSALWVFHKGLDSFDLHRDVSLNKLRGLLIIWLRTPLYVCEAHWQPSLQEVLHVGSASIDLLTSQLRNAPLNLGLHTIGGQNFCGLTNSADKVLATCRSLSKVTFRAYFLSTTQGQRFLCCWACDASPLVSSGVSPSARRSPSCALRDHRAIIGNHRATTS